MMGGDVERITSGLDGVISAVSQAIISFAESPCYRIKSKEQHAGLGTGVCYPLEEEHPVGGDPMSGVSSAMSSLSSDCGKMSSLEGGMFTSSKGFNNSVGSPWNELTRLQELISAGTSYSGAHTPFKFMGEKQGMLSILSMIMSSAVDAKWAIITYNDYIQRGYDQNYNGKKPSITMKMGLDKITNGNVKQGYDENVNTPTPSIDPF